MTKTLLDGLGLEGAILDGLDDWPGQQREPNGSASLASWLPAPSPTWLPPHELAQVEEAFIGAGLL